MPSRRDRRNAGVSLVEVVVAVLLVATAVLASAAAVIEASGHQRANARVRAVTPVLATLLDEVRETPFADLDTVLGAATRTVTVPDTQFPAVATFSVGALATGDAAWPMRSVTVSLHWDTPQGPVDVSGTTWVCDRTLLATPVTPSGGAESESVVEEIVEDVGSVVPGIGNGNGNGNGNR